MATKAIKPGSEIDAYCTHCKIDTVHRIIAVVDNKPKKVECVSCKGHHLYRAPKSQKQAPVRESKAPKSKAEEKRTATKKREADSIANWEKTMEARVGDTFHKYRMDKTFSKGDLIRHSSFGDGVVAAILDVHKLEVLFKDGARILAQGVQLPS